MNFNFQLDPKDMSLITSFSGKYSQTKSFWVKTQDGQDIEVFYPNPWENQVFIGEKPHHIIMTQEGQGYVWPW